MFDTSKFFNPEALMSRYFRKVDNVVWDMMTGKIGILTSNGGISSIDGEGDAATITTNLIDQFGMAIPAFAQQTPIGDVKVGDMILQANDKPAWVVAKFETETAGKPNVAFELLRADGTSTKYRAPKVNVLGFDAGGVMVVRSLLSMLPGGAGGLGEMQNAMLMLSMAGGDASDIEDMLPMMLMSQMGGIGALTGGATAAPAAGGMGNMVQMMLMAKMMGGGKKRDSSARRYGAEDSRGPFDRR